LFRAVLEGVALEYALYQQALRRLLPGAAFSELRITGGGEKSAVWNQIKADALQMPIAQIENGGGAPMGAAMLAGVGAGIFPGPHAALFGNATGRRTGVTGWGSARNVRGSRAGVRGGSGASTRAGTHRQ
jgi:sugar (pentulose or hexulose) kinase